MDNDGAEYCNVKEPQAAIRGGGVIPQPRDSPLCLTKRQAQSRNGENVQPGHEPGNSGSVSSLPVSPRDEGNNMSGYYSSNSKCFDDYRQCLGRRTVCLDDGASSRGLDEGETPAANAESLFIIFVGQNLGVFARYLGVAFVVVSVLVFELSVTASS